MENQYKQNLFHHKTVRETETRAVISDNMFQVKLWCPAIGLDPASFSAS